MWSSVNRNLVPNNLFSFSLIQIFSISTVLTIRCLMFPAKITVCRSGGIGRRA